MFGISQKKLSIILVMMIVGGFFYFASQNFDSTPEQQLQLQAFSGPEVNEVGPNLQPTKQIPEQTEVKKSPSIKLGGFLRKAEQDGRLRWRLSGEDVEIDQAQTNALIQLPSLTYYNPDGEIKIIAEFADVALSPDSITEAKLERKVLAETSAYVLQSDSAIFRNEAGTLSAQGNVKIFSDKINVKGNSSFSRLNIDEHEVRKNVDSEIKTKDSKSDRDKIIKVTSGYLRYNSKAGDFKYQDNVVAVDGAFTIKANDITGIVDGNQELKRMVATGNVRINDTQMSSQSDKAVFNLGQNEVELTGNPEVTQNRSVLKGSKIVYNLETEKSQATGDVSVSMLEG